MNQQPVRKRQESLPKFLGLTEIQKRLSERPESDTEDEANVMLEFQKKLAELSHTNGQIDSQRQRLRDIVPECFDDEDEVTGVTTVSKPGA